MSAKTTPKRPVRPSAVVGIVIWSLVFCLLGAMLLAGLTGVGFRILYLDGFPVLSFGGFTYEDADSYSVGNGSTEETVNHLSVSWLTGKITVEASEDEKIHIFEDYDGENSALRLRWKVEEGELKIRFRKPVLFGNVDAVSKNLTVRIPQTMLDAMNEVEIDGVDCDVSYTGNADELSLNIVAGEVTVSGDLGELDVEAVDGKVTFRGAVRAANFDCLDAEAVMYLDMATRLDFDQVDADVTLYLSEEIQGFDAELDSVGGAISVEGFDGMNSLSDKSARWGDGSLRIVVDGVDVQLNIKKLTKD